MTANFCFAVVLIGIGISGAYAADRPQPAPDEFRGLIGEYARDRHAIIIYERAGSLHVLMGWFQDYATKQETDLIYRLQGIGNKRNEKAVFIRDAKGKATRVEIGETAFIRRQLDGEDGQTFRIKPIRPVDELRKEALAAKPPIERKNFRESELVDVSTIDDAIKLDIRYATANNFLSTPVYKSAKAYMQRPAAGALAKANEQLKKQGYGLLIHDAYRPWYVTKIFYEATPEKMRNFVADPSLGSRHNRGCAVDLTLYELKTGKAVEMVSGYDEFSPRAFANYPGGTSLQRWHRDLLRRTMESQGFSVYPDEWWHFDFQDWKLYPIGNQTFEGLGKR